MKGTRFWTAILAALLLVAAAPLSAEAQTYVKYWLEIVGDDSPNNTPLTVATCRVLTAGGQLLPTIYTTDALSTAASNPLSPISGTARCEWYGTATSYDVVVVVPSGAWKGSVARINGVTRTGQKRVIVTRSSGLKQLVIAFTATASTATTTKSETIPAGARVESAILETTTAVAASTFNVNIAGVNGSVCSAITTAAVGFASCTLDGNASNVVSAAAAVTVHNQNHASAGFVNIWYRSAGG